jgi:DNA-binding transcriptional MerR regulator/methylmalonyl-CoA mutase cobalamin-binding subunit
MPRSLLMSIAAVERDTGLSKDTLRIWEKRYGFPVPERDALGERCYPMAQVERLRLIKRLLDVGHRPGRVVGLPDEDLQTLADRSADAQGQARPRADRRRAEAWGSNVAPAAPRLHPSAQGHPGFPADWLAQALARVDAHDTAGFKRMLAHAVPTLGLGPFITEVCAPLLQAMGEGWLRGRFQVSQEHWVSQSLQQSLHAAIHALPAPHWNPAPRVLLSTFPGEPHSMGLLMVEGWLTLQGAEAINLGPQTPTTDLIDACERLGCDVVALSFSASAPAHLIQDALPAFRSRLAPEVQIWAGGRNPLLARKPVEGVTVLTELSDLSRALQSWQAHHGAGYSGSRSRRA